MKYSSTAKQRPIVQDSIRQRLAKLKPLGLFQTHQTNAVLIVSHVFSMVHRPALSQVKLKGVDVELLVAIRATTPILCSQGTSAQSLSLRNQEEQVTSRSGGAPHIR